MTPELTALTLAALLQFAQVALYSGLALDQVGVARAAGPRDGGVTLQGRAGRASRALNNHFEGLILFGIAVGVLVVSGQTGPLTATLAWIYLAARLAYVPAYLLGWTPWRTLIWAFGAGATLLMLLVALL
ncbi:MAPEG family protein [Allosediminivita pacifica]|uniref:Putative MAPEG superfamily protein n=1 Tax=Allosediminivita pacifica TaxID=1267769 RepID=A0A2T6BA38_9RHOB|nr:MAPEG family protein [Allosediminivita pacifica]PTX52913.1 putative MAPEG superfamily protein [Allosediminivita pacifica]GGA94620.1 membrane protein [Allosediminivita pacifica]